MYKIILLLFCVSLTYALDISIPNVIEGNSGVNAFDIPGNAIVHRYKDEISSIYIHSNDDVGDIIREVKIKYANFIVKDALTRDNNLIIKIGDAFVLIEVWTNIASDQKTRLPGNNLVYLNNGYVKMKDGKPISVYGNDKHGGWGSEKQK